MEDIIMNNNMDIIESTRLKVIRLSNQLLIGNFSSPHAFTFDDGSVLPAVSNYDSMRLKVNFNETIVDEKSEWIGQKLIKEHKTVSLDFTLSQEVCYEMKNWLKMWEHNDVDIVLCPLPMIQAMHQLDKDIVLEGPFRAVRMKDRIKKTSSIDTFCIGDSNGKAFRTLN